MENLAIGDTGNQLVSKFNSNFAQTEACNVFNVRGYGAIGDGITNDTVAVQYAITLAKVNNSSVYFPAGTYLCNSIEIDPNVNMFGDGAASIIKSAAAEPLLYMEDIPKVLGWVVENIYLDGNNIGTIGLQIYRLSRPKFMGLFIYNFTQYGIYTEGTLIGSLKDCSIFNCNVGFRAKISNDPVSSPNIMTFFHCAISNNATYAVMWDNGLQLHFIGCNMEWNGTEDDPDTGAIYYSSSQISGSKYGNAVTIDGCWFESNYGTVVKIVNPEDVDTGGLLSVIKNTFFTINDSLAIHVFSDTGANRLILQNSTIHDGTSLKIDGAKAVVINNDSYIYGSITIVSGQYINPITWDHNLKLPQINAALTDDIPTDTEIDTATGLTPATAGAGWQCTILDNNGSGLCYKVESDGTNWQYTKMAIAVNPE